MYHIQKNVKSNSKKKGYQGKAGSGSPYFFLPFSFTKIIASTTRLHGCNSFTKVPNYQRLDFSLQIALQCCLRDTSFSGDSHDYGQLA